MKFSFKRTKIFLFLFIVINCMSTYATTGCTSDSPCEMNFQNQSLNRVCRVDMPPYEYMGIFPLTLNSNASHVSYYAPTSIPSNSSDCQSFNNNSNHQIKLSYMFKTGEKNKDDLNVCTFGVIEACGYYWETICEQTCTQYQVFYIGLVPSPQVQCSGNHNVVMQGNGYIGNTNGTDFYKSIDYIFQ